MRIRETKEEEREISFEKLCLYEKADTCGWMSMQASIIADKDGYIPQSVFADHCEDIIKFLAKFRVTEEREMTPKEELAWHIFKAVEIQKTIPEPKKVNYTPLDCENILEGKEVIE